MGNLIISPWQLQNDKSKLDGAAARIYILISPILALSLYAIRVLLGREIPKLLINKRRTLNFSKNPNKFSGAFLSARLLTWACSLIE